MSKPFSHDSVYMTKENEEIKGKSLSTGRTPGVDE